MADVLLPSADDAYSSPDAQGFYGAYGGTFVPETVMPVLAELEAAYREAQADPSFAEELSLLLIDYVGRPSPLYRADRLAQAAGLGAVYLKREDLDHTGAHKINNTLGQCLLAKRMGKHRVIAETGAGQHGVATATTAALMGLECAVFMGTEDIRRQSLNVYKMRLLGADVVPVAEGTGTLADAVTAALRHWVERVRDTFYVIGSVVGPHPYPQIVRDFQSVIGKETIAQIAEKAVPHVDAVVACVGGGSNAAGMFYPFIHDVPAADRPLLIGAEAADSGWIPASTELLSPKGPLVCSTGSIATSFRMTQATHARRIPSRPGSTTREWGPSTVSSKTKVLCATRRSQIRRPWRPLRCSPGQKASSRQSNRRTRSLSCPGSQRSWAPRRW